MYYWVEFCYDETYHHPEEDFNRLLDYNPDDYGLSCAQRIVEGVCKNLWLEVRDAYSPVDSPGEPFSKFFCSHLSADELKELLNNYLTHGVKATFICPVSGDDIDYQPHVYGFSTLEEYFASKNEKED